MQHIGMFEAKTHLPRIIRDVQKGEEICLMNRNIPVAYIIPIEQYHRDKRKDAFARWKELGKSLGASLTLEEIIAFRDEGKKS